MKKITVKVLALCSAILMLMAFASCGKKYSSVEAYINSSEVQSQLESALEIAEGSGMEMKVFAEGDTLVYEYTYSTQLSNVDAVAEAIGNSIDGQSSTFEAVVEELKTQCDAQNPQVKLVYLNADGSEIYSKVFA